MPAAEDAVSSNPDGRLRSLSEALGGIADRFERHGVLGLLLFDSPQLARVERMQGHPAQRHCLEALAGLVTALADGKLEPDDLIVTGETSRNEVVVLFFRPHAGARFYRQQMPGFCRHVLEELERQGSRLFYPHLRKAPAVATGMSVSIRNPSLGAETQLRTALEEARADADLNRRIRTRHRRTRMLELLLDRQVTSVYEPIVEVSSRTVYGYEALARGPRDTDLHSPAMLFALAEEEELIFELDCLCRASGIAGASELHPGTKLFLNVRPTTIHDPAFRAERLNETLASCRLSPHDVVFEVSEQETIHNFEVFRELVNYYRNLGFAIALDDVGAGYAGLEALLELSPDYIKVDRACVSGIDQDPARQDLLRALQSVADKTGARIIAEGLDTLEELNMLGELGITFGQGWLFGHPTPLQRMPSEE